MCPTILYMKNADRVQKNIFRSSAKDRMTHFNISVLVKLKQFGRRKTPQR